MFMFSHYTLNAFSPRVFIRYKRHACLMAVLLFICGACCLAGRWSPAGISPQ